MGTENSVNMVANYVNTTYDYWDLAPDQDLKLRGFAVDVKNDVKEGKDKSGKVVT